MSDLKLVEGLCYLRKDGVWTGPLEKRGAAYTYRFYDPLHKATYTEEGYYYLGNDPESVCDLVSSNRVFPPELKGLDELTIWA